MIGLIIGAAIATYQAIFGQANPGDIILAATSFMWVWYWIWAIAFGAILGLISLGIIGAGTVGGGIAGGKLGALLGMIGGGSITALIWIRFLVRQLLVLGGTYLLMSGAETMVAEREPNVALLVIGGIALFIGVVIMRKRAKATRRTSIE